MNRIIKLVILGSVVLVSACASGPAQNVGAYTVGGAVLGGTAGAIIGKQVNNDDADMIGAISGAVIGGAVGNTMDRQRALENQVYSGTQPTASSYPYQQGRYYGY